jgi:hypothetical protein
MPCLIERSSDNILNIYRILRRNLRKKSELWSRSSLKSGYDFLRVALTGGPVQLSHAMIETFEDTPSHIFEVTSTRVSFRKCAACEWGGLYIASIMHHGRARTPKFYNGGAKAIPMRDKHHPLKHVRNSILSFSGFLLGKSRPTVGSRRFWVVDPSPFSQTNLLQG